MREIKFRIWDTISNRMFWVSKDYPTKEFKTKWNIFDLQEKPTWKVMQFTGLKDKNGREIYEGDIIGEEGVYHFNERVRDGKVWEPSSGIWTRLEKKKKNFTGKEEENYISGFELTTVKWKDSSCGFEPFSDSEENCGHCGGGDSPERFEIIGNIYENKDLLKEKK